MAIDVGGSKTLVAIFDKSGLILQHKRFETPAEYKDFLAQLRQSLEELSGDRSLEAICCAVPGRVDTQRGIGKYFGNLAWRNVPIAEDLAKLAPSAKVLVENDAHLAALSEAILVQSKYKKVLYLSIGTGIGVGIIINGVIDPVLVGSEPGHMLLEHNGSLQEWEDFASGRAIKTKYGRQASEISDESVWHDYVKGLAQGIDELVATIQPEVIIIGGGVGAHFDKFGHFLVHELKKYENNMVKMPPIIAATHPEEAVVYGCYQFIRQQS